MFAQKSKTIENSNKFLETIFFSSNSLRSYWLKKGKTSNPGILKSWLIWFVSYSTIFHILKLFTWNYYYWKFSLIKRFLLLLLLHINFYLVLLQKIPIHLTLRLVNNNSGRWQKKVNIWILICLIWIFLKRMNSRLSDWNRKILSQISVEDWKGTFDCWLL